MTGANPVFRGPADELHQQRIRRYRDCTNKAPWKLVNLSPGSPFGRRDRLGKRRCGCKRTARLNRMILSLGAKGLDGVSPSRARASDVGGFSARAVRCVGHLENRNRAVQAFGLHFERSRRGGRLFDQRGILLSDFGHLRNGTMDLEATMRGNRPSPEPTVRGTRKPFAAKRR